MFLFSHIESIQFVLPASSPNQENVNFERGNILVSNQFLPFFAMYLSVTIIVSGSRGLSWNVMVCCYVQTNFQQKLTL